MMEESYFNKLSSGGLTNNFELDYDKPKSIKIDFDLAILNLYQNFTGFKG